MRALLVALIAAVAGCSPAPPSSPPAARSTSAGCQGDASASFRLDRAALLQRPGASRLFRKLDASAFKYFRALATQYAQRTCVAFRDVEWRLSSTAIHGDAHLEQFAVTPASAGLEDFDRAGFGPAVMDIVRYAASIHLACREVKWPCRPDAIVDRWLAAYREALDHPTTRTIPAVGNRLRAVTPTAPGEWLSWAEGLMVPLTSEEEARIRAGWDDVRTVLREMNPQRESDFFDLVRFGALQMGIGSALETKLLFRLRGASSAPTDDVIMEARSQSVSHAPECASQPLHAAAMWPLMFMSTLGTRMPEFFAFGTSPVHVARDFWVQSWEPGYRELTLGDVASEAELIELAEDAAHQLAGHFWTRLPEPLRAAQRQAQLRAFDLTRDRARALAAALAEETVNEWQRFRAVR